MIGICTDHRCNPFTGVLLSCTIRYHIDHSSTTHLQECYCLVLLGITLITVLLVYYLPPSKGVVDELRLLGKAGSVIHPLLRGVAAPW